MSEKPTKSTKGNRRYPPWRERAKKFRGKGRKIGATDIKGPYKGSCEGADKKNKICFLSLHGNEPITKAFEDVTVLKKWSPKVRVFLTAVQVLGRMNK